jgi:thioredoxin-related protein
VLAIETSNRPQLAREFTTSIGVTFPVVEDDQDVSGKLFGVQATPTTLMIDRNGQIIFHSVGYAPGKEKTLAAEIDYMLQSS